MLSTQSENSAVNSTTLSSKRKKKFETFRNSLRHAENELLQSGHWILADTFLANLAGDIGLGTFKAKDFIKLIDKICPSIVQFRAINDPVTKTPDYYVRSTSAPVRKLRGFPVRVEVVTFPDEAKTLRRLGNELEALPAYIGALGNWKPLQITNIDAALRAGKGCVSGSSDSVFKDQNPYHDYDQ